MHWATIMPNDLAGAIERHRSAIAKAMSFNDAVEQRPDDVVDAVMEGRSVFLEARIDDRPVGGVILQFVNADTVHVWLGWRSAAGGRIRDWWSLLCDEFRRRQFRVVSAYSPRPLGRLFSNMKPRATVYEGAL
jgi:hypothetical protein